MHVALIADGTWLSDERAVFHFLVVGLLGEQVQVAQVVPQHCGDDEATVFGAKLLWHDARVDWLRRRRLMALAPQLDALGVGVLHALDGTVWTATLRIAALLGIPAVLSVNGARDLDRITSTRRQIAANRVGLAAATKPLFEAARKKVPQQVLVQTIPIGAHVPPTAVQTPGPDALCVVITGDCTYDSDFQTLFEALSDFVRKYPTALFFFDLKGRDPHAIWQAVRRYGLLGNSSIIPSRLNQRQLLMGAHLLIQPQALRRARGLAIQAMACGLTVLARHDPWLDYLIDQRTAWVTDRPTKETWADLIQRSMAQKSEARRLGESARHWVREHHLASSQVERTIEMYDRLAGESYRFPKNGEIEVRDESQ